MALTRLTLLMALVCGVGCVHVPRLAPSGGYRQSLGREHPLTGRVWSQAEGRLVSPQLLLSHVQASPYLLLGESHDNVDHHLLEAHLLEAFVSAHPQASVAFEMLDETQRALLTPPLPPDTQAFAERVRWAESGWPSFSMYEPVFALLLERRVRIVAAHPSRDAVRASMQGLDETQRAALHMEPALSPALHERMAAQIRESHCGHAPEAMVEPMVRAQVFKDAFMARAIAEAHAPAALVSGAGHTHEAQGVPRALRMHGIDPVLTVAFVEVRDGQEQAGDYDLSGYDFAVFTPRVTDQSACERFKEQLERMKHGRARQAP